MSPIQKLQNGPRFSIFFGFAYLGKSTQIRVNLLQIGGTSIEIQFLEVYDNTSWNYFSKNLSSLVSTWNVGQEWQVCHFFLSLPLSRIDSNICGTLMVECIHQPRCVHGKVRTLPIKHLAAKPKLTIYI